MSEVKEITISLGKSTKNKHVYTDNAVKPMIPTVYIERSELPNPPPDKIEVTLKY